MIDRESSFYPQAGPCGQVLSEFWMQIPAKHLSPGLQQLALHLYRESSHHAKLERMGLEMEIQMNCFEGCARLPSLRAVRREQCNSKEVKGKAVLILAYLYSLSMLIIGGSWQKIFSLTCG